MLDIFKFVVFNFEGKWYSDFSQKTFEPWGDRQGSVVTLYRYYGKLKPEESLRHEGTF